MPADYVTVDVFTAVLFAGNPLAVFADARGIGEGAMQRIAAEFNYSEITFVLPPEDPRNDARVRIFTPTAEIPFAGHPNVGTAYVLGRQPLLFGRPVGDTLRFEEKAGLVEVDLRRESGEVIGAAIRAPQPLSLGATVDVDLVARCASIDPAAVRQTTHAPVFASVGLPFVLAELESLEALGSACPNVAVFHEAARLHQRDVSLFLYVRDRKRPFEIRARMFAPLDNVMEDPATGSASAALGAYLVSLLPEPEAEVAIRIEQGVEMGRRSIIDLTVGKARGQVTGVVIAGRCIDVMSGRIAL